MCLTATTANRCQSKARKVDQRATSASFEMTAIALVPELVANTSLLLTNHQHVLGAVLRQAYRTPCFHSLLLCGSTVVLLTNTFILPQISLSQRRSSQFRLFSASGRGSDGCPCVVVVVVVVMMALLLFQFPCALGPNPLVQKHDIFLTIRQERCICYAR